MIGIVKQNPMLGVMAGLLFGGLIVSGILALIMARSGASLRPVAFFLTAFLLVVLPQVVGHLALAVKPGIAADPPSTQNVLPTMPGLPRFTIAVHNGMVRDPDHVFGTSLPGGRIEDSRAHFASRMPGLLAAHTAALSTGETITALVFGNDAQATDGLLAYLRLYEVAVELDRGGAEVKGRRGLGQDRMHLLRSGSGILIVTALTEATLEARVAAIPLLLDAAPITNNDSTEPRMAGEPLVPVLQPLTAFFQRTWAQLAGTILLVLLVSIWFFKGAAWAGSVAPAQGAASVDADTLRTRLLAVNDAAVPMQVEQLTDGRIAITWRYADARWVDMMNAHRMQRTHRLLLRFDEADRAVRVTEQWALLDARAGIGGAQLQWRAGLGINFFQIDHQRVYGLQFNADGKPTGDASYSYRFNLQELKAPFIAGIVQAGWTWKPVLLEVPPGLRWALE